LQQAVGKTARRGAHIEATQTSGVKGEVCERTGEFVAAAGDIGVAGLEPQLTGRVNKRTRLSEQGVGAQYLSGEYGAFGVGGAGKQAAGDEEVG
jgi:hypothetical protein